MSNPTGGDERNAVLALLAAVKYAKDDEDEAAFAACWAADARLEITSNGKSLAPLAGREAIMAFYREVWLSGGHGLGRERETHVAEHPHISAIANDRLLARHASSFFNWRSDRATLVGFGNFHDEIVREDGVWRIALRRSTIWRRK